MHQKGQQDWGFSWGLGFRVRVEGFPCQVLGTRVTGFRVYVLRLNGYLNPQK